MYSISKRTSYDVIEYWNKRVNPNSKNPNDRNTLKHISFVKENIPLNDKLLYCSV